MFAQRPIMRSLRQTVFHRSPSVSRAHAAGAKRLSAATAVPFRATKQHPRAAPRLAGMGPSIWAEFTPLATQSGAVNLGQGFPDFRVNPRTFARDQGESALQQQLHDSGDEGLPEFVLTAAQRALEDGVLQYTRPQGHLRLVLALSKFYQPLFQREIEPLTEVLTTVGATEGLFAAAQALLGPGDEAILLDPHYDSYPMDVQLAGATPVFVPLRPPRGRAALSAAEYCLDLEELEKAVTPRTKLLFLNNPQNVPGKVFSRSELEGIADIAKRYDLVVIADEVYEALLYDDSEHIRLATLPGMFERTLTLGSSGKTFSLTGFKVGWMIGPKDLLELVYYAHQNIPFCVSSPVQEAIAVAFETLVEPGNTYLSDTRSLFQHKRDKLCGILRAVGLPPVVPQGSYFVLADTSKIDRRLYEHEGDPHHSLSHKFCRWLTKEIGVAAIPPSAFYSKPNRHLADGLARFCFCKRDQTLDEAGKRLQKLTTLSVEKTS